VSNLQQTQIHASEKEIDAYKKIVDLLKQSPIQDNEILANLNLFLTRSSFSHIMFMNEIYKKIVNTPGCIMEFGVRWGRNLALFETLRTYYEPFNYSRKIIGFDTFDGFPHVSEKDGKAKAVTIGNLKVADNYQNYLSDLLEAHEALAPRSNVTKFELVKGDVLDTLPQYLANNPETIIAFAYFDFDLYKPTKESLMHIKKHLTKGSILGFDEFYLREFPGETVAIQEVFGFSNIRLLSCPNVPHTAYFIID
jgi:hypothetical protein